MMSLIPRLTCHLVVLAAVPFGLTTSLDNASAQGPADAEKIVRGRNLFMHQWAAGDLLQASDSDGQAPVFNGRSCVECHYLGGGEGKVRPGGAGPKDKNVQIVSVFPPPIKRDKIRQQKFRKQLAQLHPAFQDGDRALGSIPLHRFGTHNEYKTWRLELLGIKIPEGLPDRRRAAMMRAIERRRAKAGPVERLPVTRGIVLLLSERNPPALFGAKLIESISKETLLEVAKKQAKKSNGVTGRVAPVANSVGRFGWRGQIGTIRDFVLTSCAMDLGFQVEKRKQPVTPVEPKYQSDSVDLTNKQTEELIAYVENLPKPIRVVSTGVVASSRTKYGFLVFEKAGCTDCHLPKLGDVEEIYSDLLLHDMGKDLSDPAPASVDGMHEGEIQFGGYLGALPDVFDKVQSEAKQEWRTPPLWGVANSAPYLHDGRAQTLMEAVLMHGGEAEKSMRQFKKMRPSDQSALLAYLGTLLAPPEKSQ